MARVTIALLALAALAPAPTHARTYMAEYAWELESRPDSCAARREFGTESDVVLLELRQYMPDANVSATVIGTDLRISRRPDPKVYLPPDERVVRPAAYFRIEVADGTEGLIFTLPIIEQTGDPQQSQPGLAQATRMDLTQSFASNVVLETGPMAEAINFLEECTLGLVRSWGLDPDQQKALSRKPAPIDRDSLVKHVVHAFPYRPMRDGEPGRVNYRLLVNKDGVPTDCFVEPPAIIEYRETACRLLQEHARFEPALDASGTPVASYDVGSIIYSVGYAGVR